MVFLLTHLKYIIGEMCCQEKLFIYHTERGEILNERENIRFRLRVNNLTSTWLINMLAKSGIVTDRSTMSAILNGTRNGGKVDEIVAESLRILDRYEAVFRSGGATVT